MATLATPLSAFSMMLTAKQALNATFAFYLFKNQIKNVSQLAKADTNVGLL